VRWGRKAVDQVTRLIAGLPKGGTPELHGNMVVFGPRLREATVLSGKLSGSRTLAGQLRRALFVACVITASCSLAPALSSAAQVTLAWDANTEPDLAGYKLYYGLSSGSYEFSVDVGNQTSYSRSGLLDGQIHYFAATAYNVSLNEKPCLSLSY